jgi:hypothetical protein
MQLLAQLAENKTHGNPLFVTQFLKALVQVMRALFVHSHSNSRHNHSSDQRNTDLRAGEAAQVRVR